MEKVCSMSESNLKRTLSTKDLVVYGIIFMIPVAPIAFYGSFLVPANGMVALAYLVGMVAMLFTGFSYATMSNKYPFSGSVYTYIQQGTNSALGFIAGWGICLDYFLIPTITYLISATFGKQLLPFVPFWAWIIILTVVNTVINLLGVDVVSKISWGLFGLQAIVLLSFIIGTVFGLINGTIQPHSISLYNPQHFNFSGVLQATGIVIVSYLGFDAISTLSEEAKDPKKSIGKAILLSIISIGTLFVIITILAGFVAPDYTKLNPDTAFLDILGKVGGQWLVTLANISIILSFGFASGQEGQTAISRILFAMGRDGILPRQLAWIHPKYRTPWVAIIFVGIAALVTSFLLDMTTVSNLVSFGALFGFILLNFAVIWQFYIRNSDKSLINTIKYAISPLIGLLVSGWIFISLSPIAKIVGSVWLLVGVLILVANTRFFTTSIPRFKFEQVAELERKEDK